jgi:diguanylate cyclase (GGDEF)-like protein/PAS domain S-box-containing protein
VLAVRPFDDPEIFRAVFETAGTGMALATPDGRFLRVNRALCQIAARSEEELLATTLSEITHPDDRLLDERALTRLRYGDSMGQPERRWLRPDGSTVWVEVRASSVDDESEEPAYLLWQVTDVTERRLMEQRLRHLADHDALTGLFNRRRFEEELERHVAHARRYRMEGAVLLIDVDALKAINDSGGHRAGDAVLIAVAEVLRNRLRQSDVIARFGGDEFAVLLPRATGADAATVGADLAAGVRADVRTPAGPVTISVGVGGLRPGLRSADDALSLADASMYRAKVRGGDGVAPGEAEASGAA